jgi:hypothetical protein
MPEGSAEQDDDGLPDEIEQAEWEEDGGSDDDEEDE